MPAPCTVGPPWLAFPPSWPVVLACAVAAGACKPRRGRQEITLKAALFVPPSTTYGIPFKRFVDRVNETGKGVLQIRIVGGPEAVPADGQAQAVKNGVLDLSSIPTAYYKSLMVEGDAQVLNDLSLAEQRKSGLYAVLNQLAEREDERQLSDHLTASAFISTSM